MPAHPRSHVVLKGQVAVYHTWSRCVRRARLCGYDELTGKDFSHRKAYIESLLKYQSSVFAIDVGGFHLLDNHQHATLASRPDLVDTWSDEEVAWRWKLAWPEWIDGEWVREPDDRSIEAVLLKGPEHLRWLRGNMSSISWFMARWKEPVARLVNKEDDVTGHMWAERFGCRRLETDGEILVASVYTDLQQVKCGAAENLLESDHSSIRLRLEAWAAQEAAESVQAFEGKTVDDGQHHLPPEVVEKLLLDSWLMPISENSPMPLMGKKPSVDSGGKASVGGDTSQDGVPVAGELEVETPSSAAGDSKEPTSPDDVASLSPASASQNLTGSEAPNPAKSASTGVTSDAKATTSPPVKVKPREKTYRIHKLRFPQLENRIRRPLLEVSYKTYVEIVERAAAEWQALQESDVLIDESSPPLHSRRATEARWRESVKYFRTFFLKLVKELPISMTFETDTKTRGDPK